MLYTFPFFFSILFFFLEGERRSIYLLGDPTKPNSPVQPNPVKPSPSGRKKKRREQQKNSPPKTNEIAITRTQKKKRGSCVSWTAFVICLICLYLLYIWYKRINLKMMIFFRQVSLISCRCLLFFIFVFLSFYSLMQLKQRTHIAAMTKTKMRKCF